MSRAASGMTDVATTIPQKDQVSNTKVPAGVLAAWAANMDMPTHAIILAERLASTS